MAAPVVQNSANNLTKPTGLADGDVVIITLNSNMGTATVTNSTGFTVIDSCLGNGAPQTTQVTFLGKYITSAAGEPATYTIGVVTAHSYGIHRISGADSSFLSGTATTGSSSTAVTSVVMPAITPADADCLIICGVASWVDMGSLTAPSGMTARAVAIQGAGDNTYTWSEELTGGSGASTGTRTATASTASQYVAVTVALRPVASAANLENELMRPLANLRNLNIYRM